NGQCCGKRFECAHVIFSRTRQREDLAFRRCESAVLSRISEIRDGCGRAHENELAKLFQLLYRLLEDICNAIHRWYSSAAFQAGHRIGSEELGVCGRSDAAGCG